MSEVEAGLEFRSSLTLLCLATEEKYWDLKVPIFLSGPELPTRDQV